VDLTLRPHNIVLRDRDLILRPMTERDWPLLYRWNRDPEVLWYTDGTRELKTLAETQHIYRSVSQHAYCFIMKLDGREIGECWLQQMNLERITRLHRESDCRRIDLAIGDARWRGRGVGTRVIGVLTAFAFARERADVVYGIVGDHNPRSSRAFERNGFRCEHREPEPAGSAARFMLDLAITRSEFEAASR
jgi:RimJ/RimL family protein N-acetyltransferase